MYFKIKDFDVRLVIVQFSSFKVVVRDDVDLIQRSWVH